MQISEKGIKLIKFYEGFKQSSYRCPAGKWTIGFGSTKGVKRGMGISEAHATTWLIRDANEAADAIARLVTVKLTQDQVDALISFIYNLGIGAFTESTLLKKLNEGDYAAVPNELNRWIYSGDNVLPGLVYRRKAEGILWSTGELELGR